MPKNTIANSFKAQHKLYVFTRSEKGEWAKTIADSARRKLSSSKSKIKGGKTAAKRELQTLFWEKKWDMDAIDSIIL